MIELSRIDAETKVNNLALEFSRRECVKLIAESNDKELVETLIALEEMLYGNSDTKYNIVR